MAQGGVMKIIPLVENTTKSDMKPKHGLSLYIETEKHKILFDVGPNDTLFENAKKININLEAVDTVIISHGHVDHGGALKKFLCVNSSADIYVQESAFEPHYSKSLFLKIPVGIDAALKGNSRIKLIKGDYKIDDELYLFTVDKRDKLYSPVNNALYENNGRDNFAHEQNLIIADGAAKLIIGCGHTGIANILDKAEKYNPVCCVGGFHLYNPVTKKTVSGKLLSEIADELKKHSKIQFYTCHCTGKKAYEFLAEELDNIHYLSCGEILEK